MLKDPTVVRFRQPHAIDDPLRELAREGASRMLAHALIAEADAFVALLKVCCVSLAARDRQANLLPHVSQLRTVAVEVARTVARQARTEGQCEPFSDEPLEGLIERKMWELVYRPYSRSGSAPR